MEEEKWSGSIDISIVSGLTPAVFPARQEEVLVIVEVIRFPSISINAGGWCRYAPSYAAREASMIFRKKYSSSPKP